MTDLHKCCRIPPCRELVEARERSAMLQATLDSIAVAHKQTIEALSARIAQAEQDRDAWKLAAEDDRRKLAQFERFVPDLNEARVRAAAAAKALADADKLLVLARHYAFRAESPGPMLAARIDEFRATLDLSSPGSTPGAAPGSPPASAPHPFELGGAGETSPRNGPGAGSGDAIPSAAAGTVTSRSVATEQEGDSHAPGANDSPAAGPIPTVAPDLARISHMAQDAAECIESCSLRGEELSGYIAGVLKEYAGHANEPGHA